MAQLPCIGLYKPCINLPFGGLCHVLWSWGNWGDLFTPYKWRENKLGFSDPPWDLDSHNLDVPQLEVKNQRWGSRDYNSKIPYLYMLVTTHWSNFTNITSWDIQATYICKYRLVTTHLQPNLLLNITSWDIQATSHPHTKKKYIRNACNIRITNLGSATDPRWFTGGSTGWMKIILFRCLHRKVGRKYLLEQRGFKPLADIPW